MWSKFKEVVYATSYACLGKPVWKHQDWFDENDAQDEELLAKRRKLIQRKVAKITRSVEPKIKSCNHKIQRRLRDMSGAWLLAKDAEREELLTKQTWKKFMFVSKLFTAHEGNRIAQLNLLKVSFSLTTRKYSDAGLSTLRSWTTPPLLRKKLLSNSTKHPLT